MKKMFSQGLALAVVLGLSNFAYAAPASYSLDEMVITASRSTLNLKELPQSAEVITKEEIKSIGATNIKEALRLAPNLDVTEATGVGNNLSIRGSENILVLVNGRRLVSDGSSHVLERFNSQNVERIEILRGPSGALYGSDAMGGVINIITAGPAEEGAVVGVTTGEREMSNYYRLDTGRIGKVAATFNANFAKVRPFVWGSRDNAGMTRMEGPKQNFNLEVDYEMDDNNKLNLFAEYHNEHMEYITFSDPMDPESIDEKHNYDIDKRSVNLGYDGKSAKADYAFDFTYSNLDRGPGSDRTFYDVEARNVVRSTDEFTLTYGAEYSSDKGPLRIKDVPLNMTTEQWAGYVYGEYRPSAKLLLTPSVRYDHHETFGNETSPSMGMTYFVDESSRIKASYGEAYRAPTPSELYKSGFTHMGPFLLEMIANPDLKPETSKGFEISYEKDFDANTSAKVAYFKNDKEDAIVEKIGGKFPSMSVQNVNADEATYEGVEFALNHDLGNGFNVGVEYNYLDATQTSVKKGKKVTSRLDYTAKNNYSVKLQWTEPEEQEWSVTAWNEWQSDLFIDEHTGSINTFNIVVNKQWENNKYNAFVALDNAFDKEDIDLRYSGRVWRVGAEVRF